MKRGDSVTSLTSSLSSTIGRFQPHESSDPRGPLSLTSSMCEPATNSPQSLNVLPSSSKLTNNNNNNNKKEDLETYRTNVTNLSPSIGVQLPLFAAVRPSPPMADEGAPLLFTARATLSNGDGSLPPFSALRFLNSETGVDEQKRISVPTKPLNQPALATNLANLSPPKHSHHQTLQTLANNAKLTSSNATLASTRESKPGENNEEKLSPLQQQLIPVVANSQTISVIPLSEEAKQAWLSRRKSANNQSIGASHLRATSDVNTQSQSSYHSTREQHYHYNSPMPLVPVASDAALLMSDGSAVGSSSAGPNVFLRGQNDQQSSLNDQVQSTGESFPYYQSSNRSSSSGAVAQVPLPHLVSSPSHQHPQLLQFVHPTTQLTMATEGEAAAHGSQLFPHHSPKEFSLHSGVVPAAANTTRMSSQVSPKPTSILVPPGHRRHADAASFTSSGHRTSNVVITGAQSDHHTTSEDKSGSPSASQQHRGSNASHLSANSDNSNLRQFSYSPQAGSTFLGLAPALATTTSSVGDLNANQLLANQQFLISSYFSPKNGLHNNTTLQSTSVDPLSYNNGNQLSSLVPPLSQRQNKSLASETTLPPYSPDANNDYNQRTAKKTLGGGAPAVAPTVDTVYLAGSLSLGTVNEGTTNESTTMKAVGSDSSGNASLIETGMVPTAVANSISNPNPTTIVVNNGYKIMGTPPTGRQTQKQQPSSLRSAMAGSLSNPGSPSLAHTRLLQRRLDAQKDQLAAAKDQFMNVCHGIEMVLVRLEEVRDELDEVSGPRCDAVKSQLHDICQTQWRALAQLSEAESSNQMVSLSVKNLFESSPAVSAPATGTPVFGGGPLSFSPSPESLPDHSVVQQQQQQPPLGNSFSHQFLSISSLSPQTAPPLIAPPQSLPYPAVFTASPGGSSPQQHVSLPSSIKRVHQPNPVDESHAPLTLAPPISVQPAELPYQQYTFPNNLGDPQPQPSSKLAVLTSLEMLSASAGRGRHPSVTLQPNSQQLGRRTLSSSENGAGQMSSSLGGILSLSSMPQQNQQKPRTIVRASALQQSTSLGPHLTASNLPRFGELGGSPSITQAPSLAGHSAPSLIANITFAGSDSPHVTPNSVSNNSHMPPPIPLSPKNAGTAARIRQQQLILQQQLQQQQQQAPQSMRGPMSLVSGIHNGIDQSSSGVIGLITQHSPSSQLHHPTTVALSQQLHGSLPFVGGVSGSQPHLGQISPGNFGIFGNANQPAMQNHPAVLDPGASASPKFGKDAPPIGAILVKPATFKDPSKLPGGGSSIEASDSPSSKEAVSDRPVGSYFYAVTNGSESLRSSSLVSKQGTATTSSDNRRKSIQNINPAELLLGGRHPQMGAVSPLLPRGPPALKDARLPSHFPLQRPVSHQIPMSIQGSHETTPAVVGQISFPNHADPFAGSGCQQAQNAIDVVSAVESGVVSSLSSPRMTAPATSMNQFISHYHKFAQSAQNGTSNNDDHSTTAKTNSGSREPQASSGTASVALVNVLPNGESYGGTLSQFGSSNGALASGGGSPHRKRPLGSLQSNFVDDVGSVVPTTEPHGFSFFSDENPLHTPTTSPLHRQPTSLPPQQTDPVSKDNIAPTTVETNNDLDCSDLLTLTDIQKPPVEVTSQDRMLRHFKDNSSSGGGSGELVANLFAANGPFFYAQNVQGKDNAQPQVYSSPSQLGTDPRPKISSPISPFEGYLDIPDGKRDRHGPQTNSAALAAESNSSTNGKRLSTYLQTKTAGFHAPSRPFVFPSDDYLKSQPSFQAAVREAVAFNKANQLEYTPLSFDNVAKSKKSKHSPEANIEPEKQNVENETKAEEEEPADEGAFVFDFEAQLKKMREESKRKEKERDDQNGKT